MVVRMVRVPVVSDESVGSKGLLLSVVVVLLVVLVVLEAVLEVADEEEE